MNGLWKKRISALAMALVMIVSLMPAALAADCTSADGQHAWGSWNTTEEATCIADGLREHECSTCHATEKEVIPKLNHDFSGEGETTTEPTCSQDGLKTITCSRCDATTTVKIPKLKHELGDVEIVTDSTCSKEGVSKQVCRLCGAEIMGTIEKKEHTYTADTIKVTKEPTCTATGERTYTCSVCSNVGKTETIEKLPHKDDNKDGKCDVCGAAVAHTHVKGTLQSDETNHWYLCTICKEKIETAAHYDNNKDGKCDLCNRAMGTTYTVTYKYLTSNGVSTSTQETVVKGNKPTKTPSAPSTVTINGTAYTSVGWSTTPNGSASSSTWYLYNNQNQSIQTPANFAVNGNITYYSLYKTSAKSTDITITAAPGKSTDFDTSKFRDAYRTQYSGDFNYVEFSVSKSKYNDFSDASGTVYIGSSELSYSEFTTSGGFNYSGGSSSSRLGNLSFQANRNAKNNSTLEVSYIIYGGSSDRNEVKGTLTLKVSGTGASGDIEYEVAPGKTVDFNSRDFRDYLRKTYSGEYLDYVRFDSVSISGGTLYCNYGKSGETSFSGSKLSREYFYEDPGKNQYGLDDLTFVASSSFKSDLTIGFTAYSYTNTSHKVTGEVVISSTSKSASGDIEYEVAPGKTVDLKATDFRKFLRDEESSSSVVDYVEFKRPSSTSVFDDGTLYYDRGGRNEVALTRSNISGYKFYYSPGSKDYDLDDLTFEAKNSFKDEITLDFTVYGTGKNEYASGTLVIKSTSKTEKGDINYEVTPGKTVNLKATDFRKFLRDEESSSSVVDYVEFKRPSSTSIFDNGTLYYDRGGSGEVTLTRSNISSYKFYYSPGSKDYDLDDLTFEAKNSFTGSITLDFTVYGTEKNEYANGTLVIYTNSSAAAGSNYVGSIRYSTVSGTNVQINANDIARFLNQSLPGYSLQYVTLTGVPSSGTLYYNYYNASKYGTASRMALNSSNCSGQSFYFAPSSTAQYALTELTYVPSSYNYCASIPFTAYANNSLSVAGTILISVSRTTLSEVYGVTPRNTAVNFPASSIYSAVQAATGSALYSIQLLKLPAVNAGTIYVGSGTSTRAATNVQYTYASGTNSISQLRFVPSASFTGSVEIPYVALNANGTALASGTFSLGVVNQVKSFTDVGSGSWCYKYVAELSDAGVVSGYTNGSFKPDSTVSYGAALKLIMLAAGYPEQAPTTKNVFSGYLAKARADGLVTRSNINLSAPITRLQVAQLAAGALKLNTSNLSSVKPFTDTSDLYVQALNAAGIVEGYFSNGTSTFRPNNSLTRGQMSAIVWRMQNYRK